MDDRRSRLLASARRHLAKSKELIATSAELPGIAPVGDRRRPASGGKP